MSTALQEHGLDQLTTADRLQLVHELWNSIAEEIEQIPLDEAQRREVDRRLAAHHANPEAAVSWEQVEAEALARLRR